MFDSVKYYLDQNVHHSIAIPLRRAGIDVVTAYEIGRCGFDDPDQLAEILETLHGVYTAAEMQDRLEYL